MNNTHDHKSEYGKRSLYRVIALSVLLVGTLDLLSAYIDVYLETGRNSFPLVSKYIASAWVGKQAFSGGTGMILLGILSHYLVVTIFSVLFFWLYPRVSFMSKSLVLTGILFAIFMWAVMTYIVVPFSRVPVRQPVDGWKAAKAIAILAIVIGCPLAIIARYYYKRRSGALTS